MLPVRTIQPPDWMTDHRCVRLMRVLGGFDAPVKALFVGGCVRNMLIDKPVKDIDIATIHRPLEVIERLKAAGMRFVPTGLDHGTVTAIVDDGTYEITTLRRDIDTNGRHAVIAFTDDWATDAQRRDFTFNTLLASVQGDVFDPTGQGLGDLEAKRVVFVGDARQRIAEDYLRMLRFFRFHAEYGAGSPDKDALEACREMAEKIDSLSRERVTQEFMKILAVTNPAPTLSLMFSFGVLPALAQSYKAEAMEILCNLQERYDAKCLSARLFALSGFKSETHEDSLVLSNQQKKQLDQLAAGMAVFSAVSQKKVRELVYRAGNQTALQTYFLRLAQRGDLPALEIIDVARYWQAPEFPIKAEQLIASGISPGPALGKTLKDLEEKWVKSDFAKVPRF